MFEIQLQNPIKRWGVGVIEFGEPDEGRRWRVILL